MYFFHLLLNFYPNNFSFLQSSFCTLPVLSDGTTAVTAPEFGLIKYVIYLRLQADWVDIFDA